MSVSGTVTTVLGEVDVSTLGHTLPHEHLFVDQVGYPTAVRAPSRKMGERGLWNRQITLENRYDVMARPHLYRAAMVMDSLEDAIDEVELFRRSGGGTIVDVTPTVLGRDAGSLVDVARATNVHVVMSTAEYVHTFHTEALEAESEGEIGDRFIHEIVTGIDGVRAGIIGEIGLSENLFPCEEKVLRAALRASEATGAAVTLHLGRHVSSPHDARRVIDNASGNFGKVVMGHVDFTVHTENVLLEMAATGSYLEFDLFGKEDSHGWGPPDWPNDADRVRRMAMLAEAGHLDQLLVSHDLCTQLRCAKYGGPGLHHIARRLPALMSSFGFTAKDIHQVLVENPARMLAK